MLMALLNVLSVARNRYDRRWGWSSHTTGITDCLLAARLGAAAIEKHLKLSDADVEAGHSISVEQFSRMARAING
jgi:sialic acid synthase SpsE